MKREELDTFLEEVDNELNAIDMMLNELQERTEVVLKECSTQQTEQVSENVETAGVQN